MTLRLLNLWSDAMVREGKFRSLGTGLYWLAMLGLQAALSLPFVSRSRWWRRMLGCMRCPIYNRRTRQCRQGDLGCGCSMPMKNLFRGSRCWAREQGIVGAGWESEL